MEQSGDIKLEMQSNLEKGRANLKEVNLMLEQSQGEMTKLTQRNAAISGHLQQLQSQGDSAPISELQMAYKSAMEAQQRLLVMRGQIEKLQAEKVSLAKLVGILEKFQQVLSENAEDSGSKGSGDTKNMLEVLIKAQESERLRLSRQMHDGPAQTLSNFIVQAEIAARLLEVDPNRAKDELSNLKAAAMTAFQKVRTFIFELRPMMLDDLGLIPTLKRYVESFKEQTGQEVGLTIKGKERRLESYLEVLIFRALQELMGNAVRHNASQAGKIQINAQLVLNSDLIRVAVSDNGKGFDPDQIANSEGMGLKLIRERLEMLGGTLEINAAPGKGCRIVLQAPVS
jgi:two-component system, NarL family, sensor histidine kinase DegS